MAYEMKEGRGSLWKNDKSTSDNNHPDQTGSFLLNGKKYNIAVWKDQKSKDGSKVYDSLSVSEWKEPKQDSGHTDTTTPPEFDDSSIPF